MDTFCKFTSIEKFSDIWIKMQKYDTGKFYVRPKIKIHGTNSSIRVHNGVAIPQKRTSDVTILADNAGFAFWASKIDWKLDKNVLIYGEFGGPGVQKSDAVSSIPNKHFFVFAVKLESGDFVVEPDLIEAYLPDHADIKIIPWFDSAFELDSNNVETARELAIKLEAQVVQIGTEDPYIKELFGISGVGEGLVVAPYNTSGIVGIDHYNTFIFKVKSEAHLVQKTNKMANFRVEVPGSVKDFAKMFITPARCQQMVDEHLAGSYSPKGIGEFLKAINTDVLKESTNELKEMNVEWKMIAKEINNEAVKWFKTQNSI